MNGAAILDVPSLASQYRQAHEDAEAFSGYSVLPHAWEIRRMLIETGSKSVLDYGCGKGRQYANDCVHEWWGVKLPTLYDPGVPQFATKPAPGIMFDAVICTDVLEHIPELELDKTLQEIFLYAGRMVFLTACCRPSNRTLPDGTNAHITVKPEEFWRRLIKVGMKDLARGKRVALRITP
jgi:hypothetical protein